MTEQGAPAQVVVVSEPLGGSPLSRLIQSGRAPASWLLDRPSEPGGWKGRIDEVRGRFAGADWLAAVAPALRVSAAARERLERVAREGGVVVTTGQQPGLFGGPIYTWSKAISALTLADAIERELGVPAAPIFWAATDDADLLEAQSVWLPTADGAVDVRGGAVATAGTPAARVPQGDLAAELALLRAAAGSAQESAVLDATFEAYDDPGRTIGEAYLRVLEATLGPLGIPILDAAHPAVAHAADALLRTALRSHEALAGSLVQRSREIRDAGFEPQVEEVAGLTPVFVYDALGVKRRVPAAEASSVADDASAVLGANVLLRPIVEAMLLPTVAYVAGPGELAYFAQVTAAATALGAPVPGAVPRWSCTLVEPRIQRVLDRLGVTREDLADPHRLESTLARAAMPADLRAALAGVRSSLDAAAKPVDDRLGEHSARIGLRHAIERRVAHQAARLERRAVAAVKRRETAVMRDVAVARGFFFPGGKRQERALSLIPVLARYGTGTLDAMRAVASEHAAALLGVGAGAKTSA